MFVTQRRHFDYDNWWNPTAFTGPILSSRFTAVDFGWSSIPSFVLTTQHCPTTYTAHTWTWWLAVAQTQPHRPDEKLPLQLFLGGSMPIHLRSRKTAIRLIRRLSPLPSGTLTLVLWCDMIRDFFSSSFSRSLSIYFSYLVSLKILSYDSSGWPYSQWYFQINCWIFDKFRFFFAWIMWLLIVNSVDETNRGLSKISINLVL